MAEYIGNRYRIIKLIGKGGMADVYLAFDTILKREVAVKILKDDMADDPAALERFKREAGAVTQLSHPNIVDVYDVGDDHDKHYIVMEYVKGYTLKQLIRKRGPIPYKEAVWMMKQLAGALLEAHRNNIIHRDIKSQNVLIKDDGTIKLSDFGIAMASGAVQLTKKDSVLGSVHYLAPELSKGKQATMQSDIYSLGIVFYELLTGDVPYKADTPVQVALMHINGSIPSVRSFNPEIPQSVENIITLATAKNPNLRYKNVALMLQDLNECLKKEHRHDPKINIEDVSASVNKKEDVHISKTAEGAKKNSRKLFNIMFLISVSVLSIIVLLAVLYLCGVIGDRTVMVKVPQLQGKTVQEAKDILAQSDLEVDDSRITWVLSDDIDKDLIISSNPAAGEEVEKGSRIKLTVSNGLYSVLGNYVGEDYEKAKAELIALNFKVKTTPVDSDKKAGTVLEQSVKPGFKFDASKNNEIELKYARGAEIILSHDLKGMDLDDAAQYFSGYGLDYEFVEEDRDYFTEEELLDTASETVVKTIPELGSSVTLSSDLKIMVYYYEQADEYTYEEGED